MKHIALITLLSLVGIVTSIADQHEKKAPFRHIVCFKFKNDITPEQIKMVEKAFGELPSKIDAIKDYEWGTSVGDAAKAKGFTHCFTLTFENKAGLDIYIPHPDHQAFVKIIRPILEDLFVIDYIAK